MSTLFSKPDIPKPPPPPAPPTPETSQAELDAAAAAERRARGRAATILTGPGGLMGNGGGSVSRRVLLGS